MVLPMLLLDQSFPKAVEDLQGRLECLVLLTLPSFPKFVLVSMGGVEASVLLA